MGTSSPPLSSVQQCLLKTQRQMRSPEPQSAPGRCWWLEGVVQEEMLCLFQCPPRPGDRRPSWCSPCMPGSGRAVQGNWRSFWKHQPCARTRFSRDWHLEASRQCPTSLVFPSPQEVLLNRAVPHGREVPALPTHPCPPLPVPRGQSWSRAPQAHVQPPRNQPGLLGVVKWRGGNMNPKPKPGCARSQERIY